LKEFLTIIMSYFRLYPQYYSIPAFHSDEINRLPLIKLYFKQVVEIPRRLIRRFQYNVRKFGIVLIF
jgi:hypothetical protein